MVSVRTYAEHKIRQLKLHSDIAKQALYQALPYALRQVKSLLQPADLTEYNGGLKPLWKLYRDSRGLYDSNLRQKLPDELAHIAGEMFEQDPTLCSALSDFMGVEILTHLPVLPEGTLISELPLVKLYRDSVKRDCKCDECCGLSPHYNFCMWKTILLSFSSIVADIMTLSLLDCTEPVLVYIKPRRYTSQPLGFGNIVYAVLTEGKSILCYIEAVIDWALELVGHVIPYGRHESLVMSSYRGQTFYPRLFETETLERQGLLVLSGAPGVLRHDGQVYKRATSAQGEWRPITATLDSIISRLRGVPVSGPLNVLKEHRIKWQVAVVEEGLQVALLSTGSPATYNPFAVLCAAVNSLYVEACPHSPEAALAEPDIRAAYASPYEPWGEGYERPSKVGVVPVHGNQSMRMFSLVSGIPGVVQQDACLQCCLDVCRKANYAFVIDGRASVSRKSLPEFNSTEMLARGKRAKQT